MMSVFWNLLMAHTRQNNLLTLCFKLREFYQLFSSCLFITPKDCKELQPVHSKGDQPWLFFGRNDAKAEISATSRNELTHWKRLWCWEGLGAGGKGEDRGWDGWMASPSRWMWVWVNSGSWWWTGRPGVLQFMGMQRVGHDWVTELNWAPTIKY